MDYIQTAKIYSRLGIFFEASILTKTLKWKWCCLTEFLCNAFILLQPLKFMAAYDVWAVSDGHFHKMLDKEEIYKFWCILALLKLLQHQSTDESFEFFSPATYPWWCYDDGGNYAADNGNLFIMIMMLTMMIVKMIMKIMMMTVVMMLICQTVMILWIYFIHYKLIK